MCIPHKWLFVATPSPGQLLPVPFFMLTEWLCVLQVLERKQQVQECFKHWALTPSQSWRVDMSHNAPPATTAGAKFTASNTTSTSYALQQNAALQGPSSFDENSPRPPVQGKFSQIKKIQNHCINWHFILQAKSRMPWPAVEFHLLKLRGVKLLGRCLITPPASL